MLAFLLPLFLFLLNVLTSFPWSYYSIVHYISQYKKLEMEGKIRDNYGIAPAKERDR